MCDIVFEKGKGRTVFMQKQPPEKFFKTRCYAYSLPEITSSYKK